MPADPSCLIHHEKIPRSDGRQELRVLYPSRNIGTRHALETVADGLCGFGIAESDIQAVQQVLAEILNNVVEHAYGDDADCLIELRIVREDSSIRAQVIDTGRPMPGGQAPDPDCPDPCAMPEGGFGWYIIRALSDDVTYVRDGERNTLSVALKLHHAVRPT